MSDARLTYHLPEIDQSRDRAKQVETLMARKTAIETIISERHRVARRKGIAADVRDLSATLRAIKRQLVVVSDPDSGACSGCGSLDFHWPTAKFHLGRTWCSRCWKAKAREAGG